MGTSKLDTLEGRPDFIKRFVKSYGKTNDDILAADATETAASAKVAHQGWTIPAGGNGNPNAMRETIIAMNIGSDIGTDDDAGLGVGGGGGGGYPGTSYLLTLDGGGVGYSAGMAGYGIVAIPVSYPDKATADNELGVFEGSTPVQAPNGVRIFTGANMSMGPQTTDGFDLDGSITWEVSYAWDGMMSMAYLSFYGTPLGGNWEPIAQADSLGAGNPPAGGHGATFWAWTQGHNTNASQGTMIEIRY